LRNSSGSLAILAAIRRASSRVSGLAADRQARLFLEIDIGKLLSVVVAYDEAGGLFLNRPGRRSGGRG